VSILSKQYFTQSYALNIVFLRRYMRYYDDKNQTISKSMFLKYKPQNRMSSKILITEDLMIKYLQFIKMIYIQVNKANI